MMTVSVSKRGINFSIHPNGSIVMTNIEARALTVYSIARTRSAVCYAIEVGEPLIFIIANPSSSYLAALSALSLALSSVDSYVATSA
jgi:hypothetical protein